MVVPPNSGNSGPNPNQLSSALARLLEDQGDYNNLLKNAIRDLERMDRAYDKIEARLASLNDSTVNIKQANQEILKLKQKEFIAQRALQKLETNDSAKQALALAKQQALADQAHYQSQGIAFDLEKEILYNLEQQGDIEAVAIYAQEKQVEIAKKKTELGREALETEKKVSKQMGISGNLMKIFAEKIGVGEEAYEAMTFESRKLVDNQGNLVKNVSKYKVAFVGLKAIVKSAFENLTDPAVIMAGLALIGKGVSNALGKVGNLAKGLATSITGSGGPIAGITSGISSMLTNIPLVGGLLAGVVDIFSNLLDFAVGATSKVQEMGRSIGLNRTQAISLNNQFSNFATLSGKSYLNSEAMFKSQVEISDILGVNNQISNENLQTQIELTKFLGVDAQTVAKIQQASTITGKSQDSISKSVFSQVRGLQKATGIQLDFKKILKEAANLGGALGLQFALYPEKIAKAVVTTKALGMDLKQMDGLADTFLDFESSISKEFEAQLLTGKDINLSKVRELALSNDIAGMAAEISKQIGSAEEFSNMNRFAQEAYASSVGMSRDQLAEVLIQQKQMAAFGVGTTKELNQQVKLLRQQGREQEIINKLGSEGAYNDWLKASAAEDLNGFIEKLKQSFADLITNTGLDKFITKTIAWLSEPGNIMKIVNQIQDIFASVVGVTGAVIGGIMRFLNSTGWLTGIDIDESMISMVEGAGDQIRSAKLGSLSVGGAAAKDKAGTSKASSSSEGGSSTKMGMSTQPIIVNQKLSIDGKDTYINSANAANQGSKGDNVISTKTGE